MARHETDVTSLVFGVLFLGLTALWALVRYGALSLPAASVMAPLVLILAGVSGLALTLRRSRRS